MKFHKLTLMKFPIPTVGEMVKINRGKMGEKVRNGGNGDQKNQSVSSHEDRTFLDAFYDQNRKSHQ